MLLYSFSNLYTYDIFQRHCFGNYYGKLNTSALNAQFLDSTNLLFFSFRHVDILKEMSYNPKMGEQFGFVMSTSTRYRYDRTGEFV